MRRRLLVILSRLLPLLTIVTVLILTLTAVFGDMFVVDTVYINSTSDLFNDVSLFKRRQNLLFLSTEQLSREIKAVNPLIDTVEIHKRFPKVLAVEVKEREPMVRIVREQVYYFIDREGVVLPPTSRFNTDRLPTLLCNFQAEVGNRVNNPLVKHGVQLVFRLSSLGESGVSSVICDGQDFYSLHFTNTTVLVGVDKNPLEVATSLQFLFKQFRIEGTVPEVVDLRFDKPVLRPKGMNVEFQQTQADESAHE